MYPVYKWYLRYSCSSRHVRWPAQNEEQMWAADLSLTVNRDVLVKVSGVSGLNIGHDFAYTKFEEASRVFSDEYK